MLASRLATIPRVAFATALTKPAVTFRVQTVQYATRSSRVIGRVRKATLKERAMAPATDSAFNIGKGVLAGGSVVGLGALCYYGLGMSNQIGAIDRAA